MNIGAHIKTIGAALWRGCQYLIGPIDPNNEKFNIKTRFKLALLSFGILSVVFVISFIQAVKTPDVMRAELFLSFARHISYVLGAIVASYVGLQSVFPDVGWRDGGSVVNVFRRAQNDRQPPVGPGEEDADQG